MILSPSFYPKHIHIHIHIHIHMNLRLSLLRTKHAEIQSMVQEQPTEA